MVINSLPIFYRFTHMSSIIYTKRIAIFALFFFSFLFFTKKSLSESRRLYTPLDNFIELPTIEVGGFIHSKAGHSVKRNKTYSKKLLPDYDYSHDDMIILMIIDLAGEHQIQQKAQDSLMMLKFISKPQELVILALNMEQFSNLKPAQHLPL